MILDRFASARTIQRDIVRRQDALIKEARHIISTTTKDEGDEHTERLMRLGFTAAHECREHQSREQELRARKSHVASQEAIAMKYPGFRYVEESVMDDVCKKYGLVIGSVDRYLGKVPAFAAKAIEESGIFSCDVVGYAVRYRRHHSGDVGQLAVLETREEAEAKLLEYSGAVGYTMDIAQVTASPNLLIAAPEKAMRIGRHEEVQGNRIVRRDPIVMIQEGTGYVVLTAWDEEGRDPRILNAANN